MRKLRLVCVLLIFAAPLGSETLSARWKDWPRSPEAYFLTAEERGAWKDVKSDAQAEEESLRIILPRSRREKSPKSPSEEARAAGGFA